MSCRTRLAWQAALRKIKVKLGLLTDLDILLMVENGIRRGTRHAIHRYVQANNKYMEDYNKYRKSLLLNYWDINIHMDENVIKVACRQF